MTREDTTHAGDNQLRKHSKIQAANIPGAIDQTLKGTVWGRKRKQVNLKYENEQPVPGGAERGAISATSNWTDSPDKITVARLGRRTFLPGSHWFN